jgi:hypothetical protein
MPNTLLEGPSRMRYYTDIELVFEALGGRQLEFDWLLTDLELNEFPPRLLSLERSGAIRISGRELTDILRGEHIQFIWGVLSALSPGVELGLANLTPRPFADGNESLWRPGVAIQHPLAHAEIVCWDSTCTLLVTRDADLSARFRSFFPEAIDLDEYVARTRNRGS